MTEVKFVLNTGFAGAKHREVIEFEDLPDNEEEKRKYLWEYYQEWKNQKVEGYWKIVNNHS